MLQFSSSLSLSLSLSVLEGLLLAGRTSAGQLFQNSSSEAVRRVYFALLLLSLPAAPVPACLWTAALKSNSLVLCSVDPPELQQYFLEIQTAFSHGRREMKSVSLSDCASQLLNVKVLPFQKQSGRNTTPFSLSFSSSRSPPPFSCFFSHVFFFLFQYSHSFTFPDSLSILSFCILFLLISASLPHLFAQLLPDTINI